MTDLSALTDTELNGNEALALQGLRGVIVTCAVDGEVWPCEKLNLASELEAARKVVAAAQARHEAWLRWVMAKGPWTGPEWIELDRLTVDEKDALREYFRVMEEQR